MKQQPFGEIFSTFLLKVFKYNVRHNKEKLNSRQDHVRQSKKTFVLKKTMGKGEKFNPLYFGSLRLVVRLFLLCSVAPQTYCSSRD